MHVCWLTAASMKVIRIDNAACRGLKRWGEASSPSQPPYKLVPANKAPITLPVVLYSSPIAAASQHNAKRRHMGPSSGAFPTPWSLLTSPSSSSPVQRFLTARSLFGEAMPLGSRGSCNGTTRNIGNGQQLASYAERVAHWQREQRELLQCLLQQQVPSFNHSSTTSETSQVCLRLLLRSAFISEVATYVSAALTLKSASTCCCGVSVSVYCRCISALPVFVQHLNVVLPTSAHLSLDWQYSSLPYVGDSAMHHAWLQVGLTSSVSYVTASASRQVGAVPSLPCLPHIVIRPPNLSHSTSAIVASNLACLKSQVRNQDD